MAKRSLNEILADFTRARAFDLMKVSNGQRQKVFVMLESLRKELANKLMASELDGSGMSDYQRNKLRGLFANVSETVQSKYEDVSTFMHNELVDLSEIETAKLAQVVNSEVKYRLINNVVTRKEAEAIASDALIGKASSKEWWSRQSDGLVKSFSDSVRQGVLMGKDLGTMTREIVGKNASGVIVGGMPGLAAASPNVMQKARRNAEALIRSSVMTIGSEAKAKLYQGNEDVIKGWQWLSTLDDRTTELCMAYSGSTWSLENEPLGENDLPFIGLPGTIHWNCRSVAVPLMRTFNEIMGLTDDEGMKEMDPSTRSSIDGQIPEDTSFDVWLKKKDAEDPQFANDMLGKGKADLFRNGDITLRDLINDKGEVKTLEELRAELESPPVPVPDPAPVEKPDLPADFQSFDPADAFKEGILSEGSSRDVWVGEEALKLGMTKPELID